MTEVPDEDPVIILLISGKLARTNEKAIFGYHLPWSKSENSPFLFQLGPVHYVFKGSNAGRPGWTVDGDENLVFGERASGVTFVLERDLKRMKVSHHVSGDGVYSATAWRGDWEADVQRILRCGLRCDRIITTLVRRMYFSGVHLLARKSVARRHRNALWSLVISYHSYIMLPLLP